MKGFFDAWVNTPTAAKIISRTHAFHSKEFRKVFSKKEIKQEFQ